MSGEAWAIYQSHLDRVGRAVWARDFEAVCALMSFPQMLATPKAAADILSREQFMLSLVAFRDSLDARGARGYRRTCSSAAFEDGSPDRIRGRHRTILLDHAGGTIESYENESWLVRGPHDWLGAGFRTLDRRVRVQIVSPADFAARRNARATRPSRAP